MEAVRKWVEDKVNSTALDSMIKALEKEDCNLWSLERSRGWKLGYLFLTSTSIWKV
jgi:hypothetical protein